MKILYLASSSDWHIDLWVKYFTKKHDVYLFSDIENYTKDQQFENVSITYSNGLIGRVLNFLCLTSHKLFQLNKLISAKYYARKIDLLIKSEKIEAIHAHNLYYGYVASFLKSNIPIIFTPMGSDIIIHAQENLIYRWMALKTFQKSSMVTNDSLLLQEKGFHLGARKTNNFIIQNGVDTSLFYPQESTLKMNLGINKDEFLIFSPRAITPLYNIDVILDSLKILKKLNYKFKCMFSFAFGGTYYANLQQQVIDLGLQEQVIWLGYIEYHDMPKYYNASDLVISVPSSDSSPKSVYEAMFCKKPIIISDLTWSNELLHESECVLKVEAKNPHSLSEAVVSVMSNHSFSTMLSNNAFALAGKYFDYEANMKKMDQLTESLISRY